MIVPFLMGLLAELVFESAATVRRSFDSEMSQYLEQHGFRSAPPDQAPAR